jgi:IclR family transcriptional regulator, acetate operon repressor
MRTTATGYGHGDSGTTAAARVADVLLLFLDGGQSRGVTGIAKELGISKAVVHRILTSLVSRDLITLDSHTRQYRLGAAAAALGARAMRSLDLRSGALPVLRGLRDATRETTTLSLLVEQSRVYVDQVESPHEIRMLVEIGRRFPLHAGSSSRAILAFLPPEDQERVLAGPLDTLTPRTITDPDLLREELRKVRQQGVSRSSGERQSGAGSVAAPILGADGYAIGAISVCGPMERFGEERSRSYVPLVREAADTIVRAAGYQPAAGPAGPRRQPRP